jgi:hypothetical protein
MNGVEYNWVCISQTVSGPAICGAGIVSTVALTETVESHPRLLLSVKVIVAFPGKFHKTFMDDPLVAPIMDPPETLQE